ncbi:MAG: nucleotidyl transferase AbiEii/AbiGii toxin family protein [Spirochaetales bacterium]
MPNPVQDMLAGYQCKTADDYRNALKEIIQEITLLGLSRSGFFGHGAFYGGTALRIFHGLDRFSEDLDFTLSSPDPEFSIQNYTRAVRDELAAYGFEVQVEKKEKSPDTAIHSAFIKGGTLIHLLKVASLTPPVSGVPPTEQLKIKFEVDTDPPAGATYQVKYQLNPIPYSVRLYDLPSLFAGKLHAVLCRQWKSRVKGRDFYDLLWYLSKSVAPNLVHLENRMRQSGHWDSSESLDRHRLLQLLLERYAQVDFAQAANDARPFVRDQRSLELWSSDFFEAVTLDR